QYQTYLTNGPVLGTGNNNLQPSTGQLGVIDPPNSFNFGSTRQHELSLNPDFDHSSYNTPVGAYGSLITDSFSLGGMSASDKPTFYFDYFLDTQDANQDALNGNGLMRDSARVYIGPFTRFDNSGGPFVSGNAIATGATATQFSGVSSASA